MKTEKEHFAISRLNDVLACILVEPLHTSAFCLNHNTDWKEHNCTYRVHNYFHCSGFAKADVGALVFEDEFFA